MANRSLASLRRSLRACTAEGVVAEVVVACATGSVTTAWALHLGCPTRVIGLLGAMPFLAQVLQLPGAWMTSRFGPRRAALWSAAASRQSFLPLVALPWLPLDPANARTLLLVTAGAHHALGILCNNAWVTWAGELVPERIRGRYFGRRTAVCTVASAVSTLAVGMALDRGEAARLGGETLAAVTALACAAGALSVVLMAKQGGGERRGGGWRPARALRPLLDGGALRLAGYLVAWNGAVGFSAPFFGLYVVRELGGGFGLLALYGAAAAAARTATASAWGRVVDRVGAERVLVATTFGLALAPFAWLAAARFGSGLLVAEAVVGGALLAGHAVAMFALPLAIAPSEERSHYHAAFSTAGGAAFALATAVAASLADGAGAKLPFSTGGLSALQLTFVASLTVRVVAAGVSLAVVGGNARGRADWAWRRPLFEAWMAPATLRKARGRFRGLVSLGRGAPFDFR